jgi:ubiquinone/menaquinone biosynthesis C-methylase UbiE
LKKIGFEAIGVDISEDMLKQARARDPEGNYRLIENGGLHQLQAGVYDLVLSVFTFDNIPTMEKKVTLFKDLGRLLKNEGRIVSVVSSPEIYTHEWAPLYHEGFSGKPLRPKRRQGQNHHDGRGGSKAGRGYSLDRRGVSRGLCARRIGISSEV